MEVIYKKLSNIEEEIRVEIPREDFDACVEKAAQKLSEGLEVEGFRKGHVPRSIVETRVGSSRVYEEASQIAVEDTFHKALDEDKEAKERVRLLPRYTVSRVEVMKLAPGNPFAYRVVFSVPFFELCGGYRDLAVKIRAKEKESVSSRVRALLVGEIVEHSKREIPEGVINAEIERIEEEFKHNILDMGLTFEEYLLKIKKKKEELHEGWRERARERVEAGLALDVIAAKEHIEPEEAEITREVQKILNHYKTVKDAGKSIDPARVRAYVYGILKNEKTFEFLEKLQV